MKTTNQILILLAVMSLMACKNQLHVVTLYVDTEAIPSSPLPSPSSIDQYAHFGQPAGIANKDYTTIVRKGDLIIWRGQSISNPEHIVKITSIDHKPSEIKIFELKPFNTIRGPDGPVAIEGSNELVRGKVTIGPGKEEAYIREKYKLTFTVSNKGTFIIDPEVQGHKNK